MRYLLSAFVLFVLSCRSEDTAPSVIYYKDLHDTTVSYLNPVILDMNDDTTSDLRFTTSLIGRADGSTDLNFIAYPSPGHFLQINGESIPVFEKDQPISHDPAGSNTWDRSFDILTAKRYFQEGDSLMIGSWKHAENGYLPIRLTVDGGTHFAWIRISVDSAASRLILHDCGYNQTEDHTILAGQIY